MTNRILFTTLLLAIGLCVDSDARFVELWNYEKLFAKADVVAILSVQEKTKRTGKTFVLPNDKKTYDIVKTTFKKHAVFKGKLTDDSWDFTHYDYPKDTTIIVNGWGFPEFDDDSKFFMVFLKRDKDGVLLPVSGQLQVLSSFVEVQPKDY